MFTVYSEKEIFEHIVVFNDVTPNWYKIFCNNSAVCLNMTDDELTAELIQGTPIFEYIMANGGREPLALKDFFDLIYEDNAVLLEKPRSAFFLKYSKNITDNLQIEYGMVIQSIDSINDEILTGSFKRKLLKGDIIEDKKQNKGWKALLKFEFPPSNSIVISDDFLLPSIERVGINNIDIGKKNIIWLLDALLPRRLAIDYHVTIISEGKNQTEAWGNKIAGELNEEIKNLRNYNINIEVVFIKSEHFHERILIMNYVNSSCEHGFCVFKFRDERVVNIVNKIQIQSYFSSLNNQGESEYIIANKDLTIIKTECNGLTTHIQAGTQVYRGAILGDCNPDKSLKNRLINDV
jgi:hypothetical protein